jgi:hypothetical protein
LLSQEHKKKEVSLLNGLTGYFKPDMSQTSHILDSAKMQAAK